MRTCAIIEELEKGFTAKYPHFREFQYGAQNAAYWGKCVEALADRDLLVSVIFCNDVFAIPPVKSFLTYYRDDFIAITGDSRARLDTFVKRGIGAVWGMVFKFILGYGHSEQKSVSMNEYFMVKTASVYSGATQAVKIE